LLKEYKLKDPILGSIADIIDEADIVQEISVESAAFGLDLICRGVSRNSKDDYVALERGILLYEALYAEFSAEESQLNRKKQ
jgi:hypothetical protein